VRWKKGSLGKRKHLRQPRLGALMFALFAQVQHGLSALKTYTIITALLIALSYTINSDSSLA